MGKKEIVLFLFVLNFLNISFAQDKFPLPCLDKRITIVAHVVKGINGQTNIADSIILDAVDSLNAKFSPICASFEVCEFRYVDNYQYDELDDGIESRLQDLITKNRVDSRINIFFVDEFEDQPGLCGKSTFEGIKSAASGSIAITKRCIMGSVNALSHEMGHFFGLEDTYANGNEHADESNCATAGDKICDTPADPYVANASIDVYINPLTCIFHFMGKDSNGDFYEPDVSNIMSSYPCRCRFSDEQYRKMAQTYITSDPKTW